MEGINLHKGEKIIEEIRPSPKLKDYFFIMWMLPGFLLLIFISVASVMSLQFDIFAGRASLFSISISIAIFLIISIITAVSAKVLSEKAYGKYHYWITNKRIIARRGIIGYATASIPYDRISDVIISKSFLERVVGITSLHIQSLAGQLGTEGALLAIPSPEKTQETILKLKRKI